MKRYQVTPIKPGPVPVVEVPMDNVTGPVIFMLVIAVICSVIGIKCFRWE